MMGLRRIAKWSLALVFGYLAVMLFVPVQGDARKAERRIVCVNNCRSIAQALLVYNHEHGRFPPAFLADEHGTPIHSWRVLILPFLDEQALFDKYRFDEPWNGPHNVELLREMPDVFRCPSYGLGKSEPAREGFSNYVVITGPDTIFPGGETVTHGDIQDGAEQTLLVIEVSVESVPWLSPQDLTAEQFAKFAGDTERVSNHEANLAIGAFADGHGQVIVPTMLDAASLMALTTRAKHDAVLTP
ncbi:MAG: DUF1559 domain-containing protein [Planctomycetales bacterium]|nr:DUF1559 domain-containing protein [Planctomycetales bacterium]